MLPGFLRQGVSYAARPGVICPSAISSSHRVASPYMQRNGMDAETEYLRRVAGGDQEAFRLLFTFRGEHTVEFARFADVG